MSSVQTSPSIKPPIVPESLHPSLWRASQLAHASVRCIDSGHPSLATQLPGGGWPISTQTDVLTQQAGVGELRLLAPALRRVAKRKIVLISPPHAPQIISLAAMGLAPEDVLWLKPTTSADSFWAVQQALASGTCGAVLFWSLHARSEALRRLNLASQAGEALFFMFRPLSAALDPSPAPLRIELRPAAAGVEVTFIKRRGPQLERPILVPLPLPTLTPVRTPIQPTRSPVHVGADLVDANRAVAELSHPG